MCIQRYAGAPAEKAASMDTHSGRIDNMTNDESPDTISDRIALLLSSKSLCVAGLFALFLHNCKGDEKRGFQTAVGESFNDMFQERINHVLSLVPDELVNNQLGIINHATSLLRNRMSMELRQSTVLKLERLLIGNGKFHLIDYARMQLIRRKLDTEFPLLRTIVGNEQTQASASKVRKADDMGCEFALLFSMIAAACSRPAIELDEKYKNVLENYTQEPIALRTLHEAGVGAETEAAFQALYVQAPHIRRTFVHHCDEMLSSDGSMPRADRMLVDLLAASLEYEELLQTQLAA